MTTTTTTRAAVAAYLISNALLDFLSEGDPKSRGITVIMERNGNGQCANCHDWRDQDDLVFTYDCCGGQNTCIDGCEEH